MWLLLQNNAAHPPILPLPVSYSGFSSMYLSIALNPSLPQILFLVSQVITVDRKEASSKIIKNTILLEVFNKASKTQSLYKMGIMLADLQFDWIT